MLKIFLFCYGISIALPDIVVAEINNVRFRLDDVIIIVLFIYSIIIFLSNSLHFTRTQIIIIDSVLLFALYCLQSIFIGILRNLPLDFYSFSRMIMCVVIFVTFVIILKEKRFRTFNLGFLVGSVLFLLQFIFRYYDILGNSDIEYYYQIKKVLSFETWNPNNTANTAIMLAFILILTSSSTVRPLRNLSNVLSALLITIPFLVFSRGAVLDILIAGLSFFLLSPKGEKFRILALYFIPITLSLIYYFFIVFINQSNFVVQAFTIDLRTGRGLSRHDIMWKTALDLIVESPILGHGFGQEILLYKEKLGSGMAHNAFLSVWVECGFIGLLIFIFPFLYMIRKFLKFLQRSSHINNYDNRVIICLSFLIGLLILNLSQSASYWYKQQMLIFTMMVIYLGIFEDMISKYWRK